LRHGSGTLPLGGKRLKVLGAAILLSLVFMWLSHTTCFGKFSEGEVERAKTRSPLVANKVLAPLVVFWDPIKELREWEWILHTLLAKVERPISVVYIEEELEARLLAVQSEVHVVCVHSEMARFRGSDFIEKGGPQKLRERFGARLKLGFIHLSDEKAKSHRHYEFADYVYRNYWDVKIERNIKEMLNRTSSKVEVRWMILGPAPSFVRPISPGLALPASLRKQVCAFYGSNGYGDRPEMHQALSHKPPIWDPRTEESIRCGTGTDLSARDYQHALSHSIFTLCPKGGGDETFRLAETLQSGGIPILSSSYFSRRWLSNTPLIIRDSWKGINEFITNQLELNMVNGTYLDVLQSHTALWWSTYVDQLQTEIANLS